MVVSNILLRTFFIKADQYGSAFTLDVDGQEYLVTAKHLLNTSLSQFPLRIFLNEKWQELPATVIGHGQGEIDISVLKLANRMTPPEFEVIPTIADLVLGQDAYFLGFPYKMWGNVGLFLGGMPCAFAKKGTISFYGLDNPQIIYVDAINNEGFSGGPLIFYPHGRPTEVRIAGVVSKYRVEYETVIDSNGDGTCMTVPYNTGFLVAYGAKHILSIISAAVRG